MILQKLENLLGIRSGEWRETLFFWSFNMLLWFSLSLGDAISDTLFIKRVGFDKLPFMFIACSACAIVLSLIFTGLQHRLEKRKLTILLGFASSILLFVGIKLTDYSGSNHLGIYYYLYLIKSALIVIISMNFSVLISSQFNSLKGKRLIPIIFTGAIAGHIASGLFLNVAAGNITPLNILWSWLFIHSSAFVLFFFGSERALKNPLQQTSEREKRNMQKSIVNRIKKLALIITSSKIGIFLVISSFLGTVIYYFADFQTAIILNNHFSTEGELARFYGHFNIVSAILAFLIQSLLTGNLIHKFGIGNSNLVYPIVSLSAFIATLTSFTFIPGVFLKFVSEGLSRALYIPTEKLFYNALPSKDKSLIISVTEGIIIPFAAVVAGIILLLIGNNLSIIQILPCIIGFIWVLNCFLLKKPYKASLMQLLRSSNLSFHNRKDVERLNLDKQTIKIMLSVINTADNDSVKLIFQLVLSNGDKKTKDLFMKKILDFTDNKKAVILNGLRVEVSNATQNFYLSCLETDNNELIDICLKGLSSFPSSERLRSTLFPFLESKSSYTQGLAAVVLVRIGDLAQMMQAMEIIQSLLDSENHQERIKGIEILGYTCDERFWVNLKVFLESPHLEERIVAVKSFENLVYYGSNGEYFDVIGQLLKDRNREIRFYALKIVSKLSGKKWFYHAIEGLSDVSPRNRKLAEEILVLKYDEMTLELMMILENSNSSVYAKTSVVKILAASQDAKVREYLHQFGRQVIQKIYEYKVEEYFLDRDLGKSSTAYIQMVIKERAWAMVKLIVCLVAPEQNREARDLFKSLYSTDEEMICNAIEVLQNMGESKLVYHIIPILENMSLKDIANYGMKVFDIREREADVIIGKYLSSPDNELKEAAVYTVCSAELEDMIPMVKNIENSSMTSQEINEICIWTLSSLDNKGIVFDNG